MDYFAGFMMGIIAVIIFGGIVFFFVDLMDHVRMNDSKIRNIATDLRGEIYRLEKSISNLERQLEKQCTTKQKRS